ncbi:OST-HTH/LOTUS domain-containing protein [Mariniflexile soesokkakense]|uniref:OST-HTH/LOTUS domain-containing protein n=1 Tax=Mariniflexile soesokkakense TaxID=1343160 RepID=A0ABV0A8Y4_9FLAO
MLKNKTDRENKDTEKPPHFDSRNFGFDKLTPLIKSIDIFELEKRENPKNRHKLIFVRIKAKQVIVKKKQH